MDGVVTAMDNRMYSSEHFTCLMEGVFMRSSMDGCVIPWIRIHHLVQWENFLFLNASEVYKIRNRGEIFNLTVAEVK